MNKNLFLIIAIVLFFVAAAGWIFAGTSFYFLNQNSQAFTGLSITSTAKDSGWGTAQAQAQITSTSREAAWSTSQTELQTTSTAQQSKFHTTYTEQQALLQKATEAFSAASQDASEQSTQIADLRNSSATQSTQIEDFNYRIRCTDRPASVNFTSNATVSASLKAWLNDTQETINTTEWEVVWDGTEIAIHRLEGEYYYVYVVYFDEPDNYFYHSIYDVYGHCFVAP